LQVWIAWMPRILAVPDSHCGFDGRATWGTHSKWQGCHLWQSLGVPPTRTRSAAARSVRDGLRDYCKLLGGWGRAVAVLAPLARGGPLWDLPCSSRGCADAGLGGACSTAAGFQLAFGEQERGSACPVGFMMHSATRIRHSLMRAKSPGVTRPGAAGSLGPGGVRR